MEFDTWIDALTKMVRNQIPDLEVFARTQGVCLVAGQSSIDLVDARNGMAMLVPLKDPLAVVDGRLFSRHQGVSLPRTAMRLEDATLRSAMLSVVAHLRPRAAE